MLFVVALSILANTDTDADRERRPLVEVKNDADSGVYNVGEAVV